MYNPPEAIEVPQTPSFAPKLYGIALLVAAIIGIGLWLVSRFIAIDVARDMQTWQEKLNLIAESRTVDVTNWVEGNFKELRTLADNPSLQLYMTELQMMGTEKPARAPGSEDEPAQQTYLRNLLLFTAQRSGFGAGSNNAMTIPANVQPKSKSGLAIIGNNNAIIVSTLMQPDTRDLMLMHVKEAAAGKEGLVDVRKDKEGSTYIGFVVPVFSIQGDHNAASQIGQVIGLKTVDGNLFGLLKHPGTTEKTLETILIRSDGAQIEYISPLQDGTTALSKRVPFDPEKLVSAKLVKTPGNFVSEEKDYRNKPVLATSRSIAGTPWTLVVKIDRKEALAASDERRAGMQILFFLIIAVIVLIVVATWWHAHSKRSMMMSVYFRRLAAHATAQEQLLRLVADNQPEAIYIVDATLTIYFANQRAASDVQMVIENVAGKSMTDVRGAASARLIGEQVEKVLKHGQIAYDVDRVQQDGEEKITRNAYVPLSYIPIATLPEHTPGVLIVEQDISDVVHERERRLEVQHQLVEMLVKLVDKRDPFAANHSQLVSQIAHEVAVDMELDNVTVDTTRTAGSLMNIGKIVIPTEWLTKTDSLTAAEKRTIHESMTAAADLLATISFDGPVVDTLRQWQERWDGTGPLGLKGEAILISARIIAVSNAFVGMISPRSWRTAIPIETATKQLLDQCDKDFDRRVVIALIHYVENHNGREMIKKILDGQKNAA